jgi:hypothetical protein
MRSGEGIYFEVIHEVASDIWDEDRSGVALDLLRALRRMRDDTQARGSRGQYEFWSNVEAVIRCGGKYGGGVGAPYGVDSRGPVRPGSSGRWIAGTV